MTLDREIHSVPVSRLAFEADDRGVALAGGQWILELKFRRCVPPVFAQLIEKFGLEPRPVSKYRLAAAEGCVAGWAERAEPAESGQDAEEQAA